MNLENPVILSRGIRGLYYFKINDVREYAAQREIDEQARSVWG